MVHRQFNSNEGQEVNFAPRSHERIKLLYRFSTATKDKK